MKTESKPSEERSKEEIIRELKEQGLTAKQISDRTGMNYNTVYHHYRKYADKLGKSAGSNADRKKCRTCQYRGGRANGCDYIEIEKRSRGCSVEECDKYIRGKRIRINQHSVRSQYGDYSKEE